MTQPLKTVAGAILMATILVGGYCGWPYVSVGIAVWSDVHRSNRARVQLLYRTDHVALLAACRAVMTNRHKFARDPKWHGADDPQQSFIDPRDTKVPAVIVGLKPRDIIASDGKLELELHGGFDHYGVIALSEQAARTETNGFSGPFRLIPGLWYYDEGLTYDRAAWIKKLNRMRPPDVAEPKWE